MRTLRIVLATVATSLALATPALAQAVGGPAQADIDACNREAQLNVATTLPGSARSVVPPGDRPPAGARLPSAAGATGDTGSLSGGSTLANSAESGMRVAQTDPGYQQIYQDCMRRRGHAE